MEPPVRIEPSARLLARGQDAAPPAVSGRRRSCAITLFGGQVWAKCGQITDPRVAEVAVQATAVEPVDPIGSVAGV